MTLCDYVSRLLRPMRGRVILLATLCAAVLVALGAECDFWDEGGMIKFVNPDVENNELKITVFFRKKKDDIGKEIRFIEMIGPKNWDEDDRYMIGGHKRIPRDSNGGVAVWKITKDDVPNLRRGSIIGCSSCHQDLPPFDSDGTLDENHEGQDITDCSACHDDGRRLLNDDWINATGRFKPVNPNDDPDDNRDFKDWLRDMRDHGWVEYIDVTVGPGLFDLKTKNHQSAVAAETDVPGNFHVTPHNHWKDGYMYLEVVEAQIPPGWEFYSVPPFGEPVFVPHDEFLQGEVFIVPRGSVQEGDFARATIAGVHQDMGESHETFVIRSVVDTTAPVFNPPPTAVYDQPNKVLVVRLRAQDWPATVAGANIFYSLNDAPEESEFMDIVGVEPPDIVDFEQRIGPLPPGENSLSFYILVSDELGNTAIAAPAPCGTCPGDVNRDTRVDGDDIQAFADCLSSVGGDCGCADMNGDGILDETDRSLFVARLLTISPTECKRRCENECVNDCPPGFSCIFGVPGTPSGCGCLEDVPTVPGGQDCWVTHPNGNTRFNFNIMPIPPDFFGPGSDPFTGTIFLGGENAPFQPDTVVERQGDLHLPDPPPATDVVPIELIQLNLVSIQPITVTYNGGQNPEPWDVQVDLSNFQPSLGSMTVTKTSPQGGTFDSQLEVRPRFVFTQVGEPTQVRVLDTGDPDLGLPPLPLDSQGAPWRHVDPFGGACGKNFAPGVPPEDDPQCCPEVCHAAPPPTPHQHCVMSPLCPECQPRFGACCLGPQCDDTLPPEHCFALGGLYLGDDVACEPNPCDAPATGARMVGRVNPFQLADHAVMVLNWPQHYDPLPEESEAAVGPWTMGQAVLRYLGQDLQSHQIMEVIQINNVTGRLFAGGRPVLTLADVFPNLPIPPADPRGMLNVALVHPVTLQLTNGVLAACDLVYKTDGGQTVPYSNDGAPDADDMTQEEVNKQLKQWGLQERVEQTGPPTDSYNCHGYTFAKGAAWLGTNYWAAKVIDVDNGYEKVAPGEVRTGDVAVYRPTGSGTITHTGVVTQTADGAATQVESKWGRLGRYKHAPGDVPPIYGSPNYHRSAREGGNNLRQEWRPCGE
jgi:hypothetical protein